MQLYTPCILEIGKDSQEGLQEMRDAEKPTERFAYKEYMSEPAKELIAEVAAKAKEKKDAAKQLAAFIGRSMTATAAAYTTSGGAR